MNRVVHNISAQNAFRVALLLSAIVLIILAPKAAVNVDEQLHYPHAKSVVNWYFTMGEDASCLDTPVTNLKYYGQSVDNFTALINRIFQIEDEFATRHYTGAFFFWVLLIFAGLIAHQLTRNYWVATIGILSMLIMPRLFGQAFGNLKDIPFAAGYAAGIYYILKFMEDFPRASWKNAVLLGISIAFTCSVRIGGLILFAYLGLAVLAYLILKPFLLKHIVSTKLCLVRLLGQGLVIVILGYFAGLIFWPFALQDVFRNPLESLSVMEHYKVSIRQIFEGELYWSTDLPHYYLVKWLAISTPEFIILGLLLFVSFLIKNISSVDIKQLFWELFVVFTLLFPIVYVIAIHSNLYSGVRQMIFVLPLMAIFSAVGLYKFWKSLLNKTVKVAGVMVFFVFMILPLTHQAKTFPEDYIYFNSVSGGNKSAWSEYEYDYYFHGYKKATEYLKEYVQNEKAIVASNCNLTNYFENSDNLDYRYARFLERSSLDWDYALFGVNYIHPYQLKNQSWQSQEEIKTFYHKGNPICVLLKRKDKKDLNGIRAMTEGEYEKGEELTMQALEADSRNVWLLVNLAKNCFNTGDFENFENYIGEGFKIHPYYEPLYLLKAQKHFSDKEYEVSIKVLEDLLKINPRYKNALPLLQTVKRELNNK